MGSWFAERLRALGSASRGGLGAFGGVDTWEWVSIAVSDVPLDTDSGASCMWSSGARGCIVSVTNGTVCGSGPGALSRSPWCCASYWGVWHWSVLWALYSVWSWLRLRRHGVVFVVWFVVRLL